MKKFKVWDILMALLYFIFCYLLLLFYYYLFRYFKFYL